MGLCVALRLYWYSGQCYNARTCCSAVTTLCLVAVWSHGGVHSTHYRLVFTQSISSIAQFTYCCHTAAVAGIAAAVLLVISLLIALVLRKRILIAIALIKESSRFVHF